MMPAGAERSGHKDSEIPCAWKRDPGAGPSELRSGRFTWFFNRKTGVGTEKSTDRIVLLFQQWQAPWK